MLRSLSRMSAKTGVAPQWMITFALPAQATHSVTPSSSPTAGGWNERNVDRTLELRLDESFGIGGDEAYAFGRRLGPGDRLVAGRSDNEQCARTIGPSTQRAEDISGLAVDPHAQDTFELPGHGDRLEHARWADEKARHGAPVPQLVRSRDLGRADRLAEGSGQGEPVQVDPEHGLDELGVVAAPH